MLKSWLRLLRVSLAPSAAADPFAGLVYASAGFPADPRAFWLIPASLGVYHGALALNDWNDRDHDGRTRPGRPIPSGAVSPTLALATGIGLILLGIACAYLAAPSSALWMGVVALCAVSYDLIGRGPWLGPTLLALCRAGNVGSGIAWTYHEGVPRDALAVLIVPAVVYGLYVFVVSRLGRLEDGEDDAPLDRRPSRFLFAAGAVLLSVPLVVPDVAIAARVAAFASVALAAYALIRTAHATSAWTRADVERAMGLALRRLLVASAAIALLGLRPGSWDGAIAAALILLGYPIAHGLRRAFPPS